MGLLERIEKEKEMERQAELSRDVVKEAEKEQREIEKSNVEVLERAGNIQRTELQTKAQEQYRIAREERERARQVELTQQEERAIQKRLERIQNPNTSERGYRSALRYLQRKGIETGGAVARGTVKVAKGTGKVILAVGKKAFEKATAPSQPSKTPVSYRKGPAFVIAKPQGYVPPFRQGIDPEQGQEGMSVQRPVDNFGLSGFSVPQRPGTDYFGLGGANLGGKVNVDMFGLGSLKRGQDQVRRGKKGFKKGRRNRNGNGSRGRSYDPFSL